MVVIVGALLTAATIAGSALLGHRFQLAHFHVLAIVPLGALAIGAASAIGVVLTIRITSNYATREFRALGQIAGFSAYCAILLLDYTFLELPLGAQLVPAARLMEFGGYLRYLVNQEAAALIAVVPSFVLVPLQLDAWAGVAQLLIEAVLASVVTGWTISFFTGVPICVTNRRFYALREIMESGDVGSLREWERAIDEHRPIEARSIFARLRVAGVSPGTGEWMRVAVHQCSVCLTSRVRIERRHRALGWVRTGPRRDLALDARRSSAIPD